MNKIIQNSREGKEYDNAKIGPMVDRGTHHQNEKLKALRRLYQRTENNKGLRENNNKNGYYEGKTFQTIENIKREKY